MRSTFDANQPPCCLPVKSGEEPVGLTFRAPQPLGNHPLGANRIRLRRSAVSEFPYANIAGAEVKFHLLTGYFELSAGGMQNTPKSFWKTDNKVRAANAPNCVSLAGPEQANKFRRACAFIMARTAGGRQPYAAGNDAIAALERLADLRASGVLSEAEFRAMKARLLSSKP
ncbi:MAG: SHOCT domain-containing protein [Terriglobales bacterium]